MLQKEEDVDIYRVMDVWKGNRKFWARGTVSASVDLIWVTLYDRKLAEELADPHGGHIRSYWHIYTCRHKHVNPVTTT